VGRVVEDHEGLGIVAGQEDNRDTLDAAYPRVAPFEFVVRDQTGNPDLVERGDVNAVELDAAGFGIDAEVFGRPGAEASKRKYHKRHHQ